MSLYLSQAPLTPLLHLCFQKGIHFFRYSAHLLHAALFPFEHWSFIALHSDCRFSRTKMSSSSSSVSLSGCPSGTSPPTSDSSAQGSAEDTTTKVTSRRATKIIFMFLLVCYELRINSWILHFTPSIYIPTEKRRKDKQTEVPVPSASFRLHFSLEKGSDEERKWPKCGRFFPRVLCQR